jgi:hypothetical protein
MPIRFPHRGQVDCLGQKLLSKTIRIQDQLGPQCCRPWPPQDLNSHQVAALARRFSVPAEVFLDFSAAPPHVSAP